MTTAPEVALPPELAAARPRLRPEVVVGPALRQGATVVHYVKDPVTEALLRVGPREAFLMGALDGRRSVDEVSASYAERFGRLLGRQNWVSLLSMLGARGLLVDGADEARLAALRADAVARREAAGRTPFLRRFPLVRSPQGVVDVARRWHALFHPATVLLAGLAGLLTIGWATADVGDVWAAGHRSDGIVTDVAAALALWVIVCLHELAHALACARFGGRPAEIGVMWRFPMIAPYCKVDDVVLFPRRRHRVMTAFAGMLASSVALVPFGALYVWGPDAGGWHSFAALVLVFGSVATLANLVPVLQLDGYMMLNHALGMADLRRGTYAYLAQVRTAAGRRALAAYPRADRAAYASYGVVSVVLLGGLLGLLVWSWYTTLERHLGAALAAGLLAAEALALAALLGWLGRRARRGRPAPPAGPPPTVPPQSGRGEMGS